MELDELKLAWNELNGKFEAQRQLNLELLRENKLDRTKASLRPLQWGQNVQIVCGVLLAIIAVPFWIEHVDTRHFLAIGLITHAYALALIITGARVLHLIRTIDYGAPVVEIQKEIARLERVYVQHGWLIGLPWWLLWIPIALLFLGLAGVDIYASAPHGWIVYSVIVGVIGALLTILIYWWARRFGGEQLARRTAESAAGPSLTRAQQYLVEIERFESS